MTDQSSLDEKMWVDHFGRTCYVAEFEPGYGGSFFGGAPGEYPTGEWPTCGECGEAMAFLMEIDLAALPQGVCVVPSPSVLQVFHCVNQMRQFFFDDPSLQLGPNSHYCATYEPFGSCSTLRLTDHSGAKPTRPPNTPEFEPMRIAAWESRSDFPNFDEFELLGITWERSNQDQGPDALKSVESGLPDLHAVQTDPELPPFQWCVDETKVGGWPLWMQGVNYLTCPECNEQMTIVLQTRDDLLGGIWSTGVAQITQCPNHPEIFGFPWSG